MPDLLYPQREGTSPGGLAIPLEVKRFTVGAEGKSVRALPWWGGGFGVRRWRAEGGHHRHLPARVTSAHIGQSEPDYGPGFQEEVLKTL